MSNILYKLKHHLIDFYRQFLIYFTYKLYLNDFHCIKFPKNLEKLQFSMLYTDLFYFKILLFEFLASISVELIPGVKLKQ